MYVIRQNEVDALAEYSPSALYKNTSLGKEPRLYLFNLDENHSILACIGAFRT